MTRIPASGAPLPALIGARFNRRSLLVLLLDWFGLGNCLSATASSFESLVALRFVTAIPHGAYFGMAVLVAASMVPEARRGAAIGRVMSGLTLATTIGAPVARPSLRNRWDGVGALPRWACLHSSPRLSSKCSSRSTSGLPAHRHGKNCRHCAARKSG